MTDSFEFCSIHFSALRLALIFCPLTPRTMRVKYRGGGVVSTVRDVQYRGGYHLLYLKTVGAIMIHVGDIMSNVGVFSTVEVFK